MREFVLRAPTDADAVALADTMRAGDRAELAASSDRSPLEAVRHSLRASTHSAAALTPDGRVICIYGVGSEGFLSNVGCPWFLASDLLAGYRAEMRAHSRAHLAAVLALYPELSNVVDARASGSIRWLEWLGFTVERPEPIGAGGAAMRRFWISDGTPARRDALRIRAFLGDDLRTIEASPVFERPVEMLTDDVVGLLERLPSFTATVRRRIVGCAGLVPRDGGHEVWAYFAPGASMLPMFNACRKFLNGCSGPVWALVDEPSERWARLLKFRPTGDTRAVHGNRTLPIYERGK